MIPKDFELFVPIDDLHCRNYEQALAENDLAKLRDVLLEASDPGERARIQRILPDDLVFGRKI